MNVRLIITLFAALFFTSNTVFAIASITGKVVDGTDKPLVSANVILLDETGSVLIKSTLTDESGSFELNEITTGKYVLKVTMLGYKEYSKEEVTVKEEEVSLGTLSLLAKSNKMKEVTIRSKKPLIEVYADKLVVNVENSIINAGSSAMEILSRSPDVNVDNNDNISIKGRQGVNVMIDGKQMAISGTDLANLLKGMPSSNISKIEVISNPGAKYDAAGTAGIINIITKKDKSSGFNGSVNVSYAQGVYPKAGGGINLNYGSKKIRSYVSYNYGYREFFNRLELNRRFLNNNDAVQFAYVQDNFLKMDMTSHNGSFGLDYILSEHTILGVAGTAGTTGLPILANNQSEAQNGNGDVIYYFNNYGQHRQDYYNYTANANLRHNFDEKGQSLSIDVDYARYWNEHNQNFETNYLNPNGSNYQPDYFMRSELDGITQIRSAKVDYTLPLKNKARFEIGAKSSYVTSDNEPLFYEKTTGDFALDTNRSNHFIYKENINAGYINLNKSWDKWSTQIGFRVENTNVIAEQLTLDSTYEWSYTQLFPSLAIQRTLSEKHSVGLTLSRRIQRPNYQQLNPFKFFIDNTTYKEGYPYLRPALTYAVEAKHIFKKRFSTTFSYSITTDNITEVIQPSETEDSVTVQTNKNLAQVHYYSISGAYPFEITKWWSNVSNINLYYAHYTGNVANTNLSNGSPAFTISSNNSFTLPKGWAAELGLWYQSRQIYGFMDLKEMWMLNMGVQKQVFNNKGTIKLNVQDLFWQGLPSATSEYTAYVESFDVHRDTRQLSLSFNYRFGDRKTPGVRRRRSGAEDEKNRVGGAGG